MKLEMSLPQRPGMMHALPLLDLLALVLIFPMLSSSMRPQAGAEIELPETNFRLQRVANPIVVTMTGGGDPQIWLGREKVTKSEFPEKLAEAAKSWKAGGAPAVLLKIDQSLSYGESAKMIYELEEKGYRCLLAAQQKHD